MWSFNALLAKDLTVFSLLAAASSSLRPEQDAAYRIGFYVGMFVGAFIGGAIVGLLPLFVARHRGRRTFAFASWVSCVVANLLMGIFLSIPVAVVLTVVALCLEEQNTKGPVCPEEVEPARNICAAAPVRRSPMEQPDYAGSPLRTR